MNIKKTGLKPLFQSVRCLIVSAQNWINYIEVKLTIFHRIHSATVESILLTKYHFQAFLSARRTGFQRSRFGTLAGEWRRSAGESCNPRSGTEILEKATLQDPGPLENRHLTDFRKLHFCPIHHHTNKPLM